MVTSLSRYSKSVTIRTMALPLGELIKERRERFKALIDQVRWTPERVAMMRSILTGMAEYDRKERGGA